MAVYTLLIPADAQPGQIETLDRALAVKGGFRFWALAVPLLYTLFHRLWRPFAVLLVLTLAIAGLAARDIIPAPIAWGLDALIALYAGFAASDWLITARERQGLTMAATIAAHDEDEALIRFAHQWQHGAPIATSAPSPSSAPAMPAASLNRPSPHSVIGLFPESGKR
jgi:Protein of unknown function (DUF2628)